MSLASSHSSNSVMEKVGPNIIHHVSNSDIAHPIIELPKVLGIDISVTKHVIMLWIAFLLVSSLVIIPTRVFLRSGRKVPSGWMNLIELIVQFNQ